ncbi:MAG: UDP-N-acetylmuramate dehydrogenase [Bacteroidetes bacterium]|nr:UDP-N-acetylmuramate dehydrogenase [Bacteroidota bacterium]
MEILSNYSLKQLNTFGLEVKTDSYCKVTSIEDIKGLLSRPEISNFNKLVLGGGSNMLFKGDFHGLTIHNCIEGITVLPYDEDYVLVSAGGGVNWHAFVMYCVDQGYGGIENLSLIPGCVGAAPIQNIGAYGVEIKDTFYQLTAMNLVDGTIQLFNAAQCHFGYRDSIFKHEGKNKYIITEVTFRLSKRPAINKSYGAITSQLEVMGITNPTIKDISNAVIAIRQSKLPDPKVIGNAGSFFKNPEIPLSQFEDLQRQFPDVVGYKTHDTLMKVAAGWLIEKSGWKGKRVGNTGMHEKQALVLVNHGSATGNELIEHAKRVQSSVKEKFNIELEMEVNIISSM